MKAQELLTYVEELVFKTSMFGYDKDEVDVQLDKICDEIEAIVKEKDKEIEALIEERNQARKEKNYARADEIRDQLLEQGIILKDTREGVKWSRA